MSNLTKNCEQACDMREPGDVIALIIEPKNRDLGGFSVRRPLPTHQCRMVGPWIFFDHMGPALFPAGEGINVRPHPHIGISTVTYLFEGEILHRDSLGSLQPIVPGDINLMVAGRGIVHSERERPEHTATDHKLHGLQLWLALPEEFEEVEPAFHHYGHAQIPATMVEDVPVRVMMGSAYGSTSPVKTFSETLYLEAHMQQGQRLVLPHIRERAVYIASGQLKVGATTVPEHSMVIFKADTDVTIEACGETRLALIGGEPVGERFIEWNFVSSRKERIEQAKQDWAAGRFPKVPGDGDEFIPLPS